MLGRQHVGTVRFRHAMFPSTFFFFIKIVRRRFTIVFLIRIGLSDTKTLEEQLGTEYLYIT